jgi:hypothetical protein
MVMRLEEEIANDLATRMAKQIDRELLDDIMIAVLTDEGWVSTTVNPAYTDIGMLSGKYEEWYSKTAEWIHINARGEYKLVKGQWLFKDPKDAIMFILRWS